MNVARYWEIDPDAVARWSMPDFTDREEYMLIQCDMAQNNDGGNDDLNPGERYWTGRE